MKQVDVSKLEYKWKSFWFLSSVIITVIQSPYRWVGEEGLLRILFTLQ